MIEQELDKEKINKMINKIIEKRSLRLIRYRSKLNKLGEIGFNISQQIKFTMNKHYGVLGISKIIIPINYKIFWSWFDDNNFTYKCIRKGCKATK